MDRSGMLDNLRALAHTFSEQRAERQRRQNLVEDDFRAIAETGYPLLAVPESRGGGWRGVTESVRVLCDALRILAQGDASVALVSAMHPAVLSYWMETIPLQQGAADQQLDWIAESVHNGAWWGTVTSEPGSGGDVLKTSTVAIPEDEPLAYRLSGTKHFGSGSGAMDFMVTTALPEGETEPDWFFLNMTAEDLDRSENVKLLAAWDGHGMRATQSHSLKFESFPATRIAWTGQLKTIAKHTGPFIGCLFASVLVGVKDAAMAFARQRGTGQGTGTGGTGQRAYESIEWARCEIEAWLIDQAMEGMIAAVENDATDRASVLKGKLACAELIETLMQRLCRVVGGSTYSRNSPLGFWFEDVRALGFLRPPWGLAMEQLVAALSDDVLPSPT